MLVRFPTLENIIMKIIIIIIIIYIITIIIIIFYFTFRPLAQSHKLENCKLMMVLMEKHARREQINARIWKCSETQPRFLSAKLKMGVKLVPYASFLIPY